MNYLFTKYGVGLRPLCADDLEWLRALRMNPSIQKNLLTVANITAEQQIEWFNKIPKSDLHFTVWDATTNTRIGYSSLKRLKDENSVAHCGSFFDPEFHLSDLAIRFYFCQGDFILENDFGIEKLECSVLLSNTSALNLNFHIGYKFFLKHENHAILRLDRKDYLLIDSKVKQFIRNKYAEKFFQAK